MHGPTVMSDFKLSFKEAGSATVAIDDFSWRELSVVGYPGWRRTASVSAPDVASGGRRFAGGFHFKDSAFVSNLCRNRFILW